MDVDGSAAPGFGRVRDAVARVLDAQGGGGVAVAAFRGGRPVVDLWGGTVGPDSLVHTWSAVKPLVGTCMLLLVERGAVELRDPVRRLWPQLRADARVRDVLAHAAGLVTVPPPGTAVALCDWTATCAALAAAEPDWAPGSAVGEHAMTYGHLVGEIVRRVDGRGIGRFLADELAGPLGLDVHVGLDAAHSARVADLSAPDGWWDGLRGTPGTLRHRALGSGVDAALVNSPAWRAAEVPAVNGHATARGLAGFHAALLAGDLPAGVGDVGGTGVDRVLGRAVTWTLAGGQIDEHAGDIGMGGVGGQYAAARPREGLAWAFLTTVMGDHERALLVEQALLASL